MRRRTQQNNEVSRPVYGIGRRRQNEREKNETQHRGKGGVPTAVTDHFVLEATGSYFKIKETGVRHRGGGPDTSSRSYMDNEAKQEKDAKAENNNVEHTGGNPEKNLVKETCRTRGRRTSLVREVATENKIPTRSKTRRANDLSSSTGTSNKNVSLVEETTEMKGAKEETAGKIRKRRNAKKEIDMEKTVVGEERKEKSFIVANGKRGTATTTNNTVDTSATATVSGKRRTREGPVASRNNNYGHVEKFNARSLSSRNAHVENYAVVNEENRIEPKRRKRIRRSRVVVSDRKTRSQVKQARARSVGANATFRGSEEYKNMNRFEERRTDGRLGHYTQKTYGENSHAEYGRNRFDDSGKNMLSHKMEEEEEEEAEEEKKNEPIRGYVGLGAKGKENTVPNHDATIDGDIANFYITSAVGMLGVVTNEKKNSISKNGSFEWEENEEILSDRYQTSSEDECQKNIMTNPLVKEICTDGFGVLKKRRRRKTKEKSEKLLLKRRQKGEFLMESGDIEMENISIIDELDKLDSDDYIDEYDNEMDVVVQRRNKHRTMGATGTDKNKSDTFAKTGSNYTLRVRDSKAEISGPVLRHRHGTVDLEKTIATLSKAKKGGEQPVDVKRRRQVETHQEGIGAILGNDHKLIELEDNTLAQMKGEKEDVLNIKSVLEMKEDERGSGEDGQGGNGEGLEDDGEYLDEYSFAYSGYYGLDSQSSENESDEHTDEEDFDDDIDTDEESSGKNAVEIEFLKILENELDKNAHTHAQEAPMDMLTTMCNGRGGDLGPSENLVKANFVHLVDKLCNIVEVGYKKSFIGNGSHIGQLDSANKTEQCNEGTYKQTYDVQNCNVCVSSSVDAEEEQREKKKRKNKNTIKSYVSSSDDEVYENATVHASVREETEPIDISQKKKEDLFLYKMDNIFRIEDLKKKKKKRKKEYDDIIDHVIICEQPRPFRVAIVGAGIAGLTAAYMLSSYNMEVTVYEARSRVGGKFFFSRNNSETYLGEINSVSSMNNPFVQLCIKKKICAGVTDHVYESYIYLNGKKIYKQQIRNAFVNVLNKIRNDYEDVQSKHPYNTPQREIQYASSSFGTIIKLEMENMKRKKDPAYRLVKLYLSLIESHLGVNINSLSLHYVFHNWQVLDIFQAANFQYELKQIVKFLKRRINIKKNKIVNKICTSRDSVRLSFLNDTQEESYDYCILTVPIGVLKDSIKYFDENKRNQKKQMNSHWRRKSTEKIIWSRKETKRNKRILDLGNSKQTFNEEHDKAQIPKFSHQKWNQNQDPLKKEKRKGTNFQVKTEMEQVKQTDNNIYDDEMQNLNKQNYNAYENKSNNVLIVEDTKHDSQNSELVYDSDFILDHIAVTATAKPMPLMENTCTEVKKVVSEVVTKQTSKNTKRKLEKINEKNVRKKMKKEVIEGNSKISNASEQVKTIIPLEVHNWDTEDHKNSSGCDSKKENSDDISYEGNRKEKAFLPNEKSEMVPQLTTPSKGKTKHNMKVKKKKEIKKKETIGREQKKTDAVVNNVAVGLIEFVPKLPKWKVNSIKRMGVTDGNKIIILLKKRVVQSKKNVVIYFHNTKNCIKREKRISEKVVTVTPLENQMVSSVANSLCGNKYREQKEEEGEEDMEREREKRSDSYSVNTDYAKNSSQIVSEPNQSVEKTCSEIEDTGNEQIRMQNRNNEQKNNGSSSCSNSSNTVGNCNRGNIVDNGITSNTLKKHDEACKMAEEGAEQTNTEIDYHCFKEDQGKHQMSQIQINNSFKMEKGTLWESRNKKFSEKMERSHTQNKEFSNNDYETSNKSDQMKIIDNVFVQLANSKNSKRKKIKAQKKERQNKGMKANSDAKGTIKRCVIDPQTEDREIKTTRDGIHGVHMKSSNGDEARNRLINEERGNNSTNVSDDEMTHQNIFTMNRTKQSINMRKPNMGIMDILQEEQIVGKNSCHSTTSNRMLLETDKYSHIIFYGSSPVAALIFKKQYMKRARNKLTKKQIEKDCLHFLKKNLPFIYVKDVYYYDWNRNQFSRGMNSFFKKKSLAMDKDILSFPVDRLLFAGEHTYTSTDGDYGGVLLNSYLSGKREAYRLIEKSKKAVYMNKLTKHFTVKENKGYREQTLTNMRINELVYAYEDDLIGIDVDEYNALYKEVNCIFCKQTQTIYNYFIGFFQLRCLNGKIEKYTCHKRCLHLNRFIYGHKYGNRYFNITLLFNQLFNKKCFFCMGNFPALKCSVLECQQHIHLSCARSSLGWPNFEMSVVHEALYCLEHQYLQGRYHHFKDLKDNKRNMAYNKKLKVQRQRDREARQQQKEGETRKKVKLENHNIEDENNCAIQNNGEVEIKDVVGSSLDWIIGENWRKTIQLNRVEQEEKVKIKYEGGGHGIPVDRINSDCRNGHERTAETQAPANTLREKNGKEKQNTMNVALGKEDVTGSSVSRYKNESEDSFASAFYKFVNSVHRNLTDPVGTNEKRKNANNLIGTAADQKESKIDGGNGKGSGDGVEQNNNKSNPENGSVKSYPFGRDENEMYELLYNFVTKHAAKKSGHTISFLGSHNDITNDLQQKPEFLKQKSEQPVTNTQYSTLYSEGADAGEQKSEHYLRNKEYSTTTNKHNDMGFEDDRVGNNTLTGSQTNTEKVTQNSTRHSTPNPTEKDDTLDIEENIAVNSSSIVKEIEKWGDKFSFLKNWRQSAEKCDIDNNPEILHAPVLKHDRDEDNNGEDEGGESENSEESEESDENEESDESDELEENEENEECGPNTENVENVIGRTRNYNCAQLLSASEEKKEILQKDQFAANSNMDELLQIFQKKRKQSFDSLLQHNALQNIQMFNKKNKGILDHSSCNTYSDIRTDAQWRTKENINMIPQHGKELKWSQPDKHIVPNSQCDIQMNSNNMLDRVNQILKLKSESCTQENGHTFIKEGDELVKHLMMFNQNYGSILKLGKEQNNAPNSHTDFFNNNVKIPTNDSVPSLFKQGNMDLQGTTHSVADRSKGKQYRDASSFMYTNDSEIVSVENVNYLLNLLDDVQMGNGIQEVLNDMFQKYFDKLIDIKSEDPNVKYNSKMKCVTQFLVAFVNLLQRNVKRGTHDVAPGKSAFFMNWQQLNMKLSKEGNEKEKKEEKKMEVDKDDGKGGGNMIIEEQLKRKQQKEMEKQVEGEKIMDLFLNRTNVQNRTLFAEIEAEMKKYPLATVVDILYLYFIYKTEEHKQHRTGTACGRKYQRIEEEENDDEESESESEESEEEEEEEEEEKEEDEADNNEEEKVETEAKVEENKEVINAKQKGEECEQYTYARLSNGYGRKCSKIVKNEDNETTTGHCSNAEEEIANENFILGTLLKNITTEEVENLQKTFERNFVRIESESEEKKIKDLPVENISTEGNEIDVHHIAKHFNGDSKISNILMHHPIEENKRINDSLSNCGEHTAFNKSTIIQNEHKNTSSGDFIGGFMKYNLENYNSCRTTTTTTTTTNNNNNINIYYDNVNDNINKGNAKIGNDGNIFNNSDNNNNDNNKKNNKNINYRNIDNTVNTNSADNNEETNINDNFIDINNNDTFNEMIDNNNNINNNMNNNSNNNNNENNINVNDNNTNNNDDINNNNIINDGNNGHYNIDTKNENVPYSPFTLEQLELNVQTLLEKMKKRENKSTCIGPSLDKLNEFDEDFEILDIIQNDADKKMNRVTSVQFGVTKMEKARDVE